MAEFKLPLAFASKRKKKLIGLVICFGFPGKRKLAMISYGKEHLGRFLLQIRNQKKSPAENVVVKKLLSTAQDFTETIIREAKILRELQHNNIVSFRAICKEPIAMMSDFPF